MSRQIREDMFNPAVNFGGGLIGQLVTGTTQAMATGFLYVASNASQVVFTLPATCAVGDRIAVVGLGAGGWSVAPNTGDTIRDGDGTETDDTETIESTSQYSAMEFVCTVANSQWGVRHSRNMPFAAAGFAPTKGLYTGGDDNIGSAADDFIYSQIFTTDTVTTEGNTLVTARHQHIGVETTVGHSYLCGGFDSNPTEIQDVEKMINASVSSSSIGNQLSSIMSHSFGCRHEAGAKGYTIGAKISTTETNIVNKVIWAGDTWSSVGAVLVNSTGQQGGVYNTTHGYSGGGSRGGTFRVNTISKFNLTTETEANIGPTLSTTTVSSEGVQDLVANLGWFVGGDNVTVQKLDMSGDTVSQPSSILFVRENPCAASSLTSGYVVAGVGAGRQNTIDKLNFSNDTVSAANTIATATVEQEGLTI